MSMEPVLIAGGGPVGLTTALLLARWDIPSIVFEAEAVRDTVGSRAICFQRDVLDVFDLVGCADAMIAEGVTWTTGRTYYREHELFAVTFPRAWGPPPWINISQASVEGYLAAAAAKDPLSDIRADLPFPSERRFFFDPEWNPGRQVLVHQQPDSVWRIDWQVPPDFDIAA